MRQSIIIIIVLLSNFALWAQGEIFISNENKEINKINILTCSQTTEVVTTSSLSDITLHPDGNMYGVNYTTRKVFRVNMTTGALTELLTISEADKLVGMTADANGLIYITEGDVVPSRLFVMDPVTNTYESKGFLAEGSAGDLTWYFGKLYNASDNNKLVEVNIENPESSIVIGTFTGIVKPGDRIFALVSVFAGCDEITTYGLSEDGDYYRLDMNTAIADRLCIDNVDLYGATSADEFSNSECFIVLDLDNNESSGATDGDYEDTFDCPSTSSPIADIDTEIQLSFLVDSLYISFSNGLLDDTEEFLEVGGSIPGINISSAVHRVKAYNSGTATEEDFEDLLKAARYRNTAYPATPGLRTLEVVAFSEGRSDTAYVYIDLDGVDAGDDGTASFCPTDASQDLYNFIGGSPATTGTWLPQLASNSGIFDPTVDTAGTYYYYITDNCFLDSASVDVSVDGFDDFSLGNDTTICSGNSFIIETNITDPSATFLWNTGETNASITVTASGNYSVDVTIGTCTGNDDITIDFYTPLLDLGIDISICEGDNAILDADISVATATYVWNTGETSQQITVSDTGTYTILVTNGNCQERDTIHVGYITTSFDLGPDVSFCEGDSVLLDADIGAAGATYVWNTGATTAQIYAADTGDYIVTVTSGSCVTEDTINASLLESLTLDLGPDVTICENDSTLLDADIGLSGASYLWNTGATTSQIYALVAGEYSVVVTNGSCQAMDTINIDIITTTLDLGNDINLCTGDSALLNATVNQAGFTYLWNNGETTPQIYVSDAGNYSVVASNGTCDFTDDINITIDNNAVIPVDLGTDQTICQGSSAVLSTGFSTSNYTHLWSDGSTSSSITVNSADVYSVVVSNSCQTGSDTIEIITENCDTISDTTFCVVRFPTAFSPNGDQKNDEFGPVNTCPDLESYQLRIYNRFGVEIFNRTSENWNGTYQSQDVPLDNFVWYASFLYNDGRLEEHKGNVVIIR